MWCVSEIFLSISSEFCTINCEAFQNHVVEIIYDKLQVKCYKTINFSKASRDIPLDWYHV